jgi:hypothetical protein
VSGWTVKRIADLPSVAEDEVGDPDWKPIQHYFRLSAFGANAFAARAVGDRLIGRHTEAQNGEDGQEEIYVVLSGAAEFSLDGETVVAEAGTVVAVRDLTVERSAIAIEADTTVLVVGAPPGRPFQRSTWNAEWTKNVPQVPRLSGLLAKHVERFNVGVRTGDWEPMLDQFEDAAELEFRGVPVGPFAGKDAIRTAYREQPPDDELRVLESRERGDVVEARYAWLAEPDVPAGVLLLTCADSLVGRLVVTFERDVRWS